MSIGKANTDVGTIVHESDSGISGHSASIFGLAECAICRPQLVKLLQDLLREDPLRKLLSKGLG
jgi:hypothetical protein